MSKSNLPKSVYKFDIKKRIENCCANCFERYSYASGDSYTEKTWCKDCRTYPDVLLERIESLEEAVLRLSEMLNANHNA